jgi:L-histidine N-alpha-methyltransferase
MRTVSSVMGPRDRLLIGFDMLKDERIVEAAYNDRKGVTAEFNRNILRVVNAMLAADFDPEDFTHCASSTGRRNGWRTEEGVQ